MDTASAVRIRLVEQLVVQEWELVEEVAVAPMTKDPAAAQPTALMRRQCAVSTDIASVHLTRLEALPVDLALVVANNIRQDHQGLHRREEQEDTAKVEEEEEHSLAARIRHGANLGALDSTKDLDSVKDQTTGQTRVRDSTRDRAQDSVEVQAQASARVQVQTTTKGQVGRATTMAIQLLPHPVLTLF